LSGVLIYLNEDMIVRNFIYLRYWINADEVTADEFRLRVSIDVIAE